MEAEAGVGALLGAGQQEPENPVGREGASESPAPLDRCPQYSGEGALVSPAPPQRCPQHWGEGMLASPVPQDQSPHDRVSRPPQRWGEEAPKSPAPPRTAPRHWGEGMLESPVPPERPPQHWGEGMLALAPGARCPPIGGREEAAPAGAGEQALLAMLSAVASSPLPVRSQQKDEPDLTAEEKLVILRALYREKPVVFLERFRRALRIEHLACFAHLAARYEVRFYCDEVRRAGRAKAGRTRVRNKRYAALQQLIKGGEYFSDEQMRAREPLLYEQYIGQYLSDEELLALGSQGQAHPCSLSGVLMDSYQEQVLQLRLQIQQEQEHACMEEEEEDDDEGEGSSSTSDSWVPDSEEKAFLREEFTSRMHQRFLDGKDRDFDYSEVDENPEFDNLDIVARDEEERYFDGEESEEAEEMAAE